MAIAYWKAPTEVTYLLDKVLNQWHQELVKAGVRVGVIMALNGKDGEPAVKLAGYPVYAKVRIVAPKDKIFKNYDAEILIDADCWKNSSEAVQVAALDHECEHIDIKRKKPKKNQKPTIDDDGEDIPIDDIVRDDSNHPVLKLKGGDWNAGDGFRGIVERHGEHALEFQNVKYAKTLVDLSMPKGGSTLATLKFYLSKTDDIYRVCSITKAPNDEDHEGLCGFVRWTPEIKNDCDLKNFTDADLQKLATQT